LKWVVGEKTDAEVFLSAVLQKPARIWLIYIFLKNQDFDLFIGYKILSSLHIFLLLIPRDNW